MSQWLLHISSRIGSLRHRFAGVGIMLVTLVGLGLAVAQYKMELTRDVRFIGHSDRAAYAIMARSLCEGRGFDVPYISFFFIPYSRDIVHREDHWPPFMAVAIAPFLLLFGDEPWVVRLAPILIGSIGLPLATASLGYAYSQRSYVGLLSGLVVLANPGIFDESLSTLSDVPLAMLVAAFCAAMLAAAKFPKMHLLAGLLVAAAYYAKGSMLVLLGLYPILAVLLGGSSALCTRWMYAGVLIAGVGIAPWLISNARHYGSPLHSSQNFVSGYMGLSDWATTTYKPYWGRNLPQLSDRWTVRRDRYAEFLPANRERFTRYALFGSRAPESAWLTYGSIGIAARDALNPRGPIVKAAGDRDQPAMMSQDPISALCGAMAVLTIVVSFVGALCQLLMHAVGLAGMRHVPPPAPVDASESTISTRNSSLSAILARWKIGPLAVLLLVMAMHWAFIVFLWEALPRFSLVFVPFVAVIGCAGVARAVEFAASSICRPLVLRESGVVTGAIALLVVIVVVCGVDRLKAHQQANSPLHKFPYSDSPFYPAMGDFLRERLPNAVVMANNPWDFMFYAAPGNKSVKTPQAGPADIFSIARYYRVTHYLADEARPGMSFLTRGWFPGMKPVAGAPGPLFELDYRFLPDSGLSGVATP